MADKKLFFFLFLSAAVLSGCSIKPHNGCKPVLMPYVEYGYKAESQKLSGSYIQKNKEIIDFHGVKLVVPQGWSYETVFAGRTIKFSKDKDRFFILNFKNNKLFRNDDIQTFKMIGCKNFSVKNKDQGKTRIRKEFYTDLYLFTGDQLDSNPTFWQYYILWTKTEFLRDAVKLIHYTGENLEAFQRNIDPRTACAKADVVMQSEIFPKKIAPDYLAIAAGFRDDAFFVEFLEMLNAMNPS